MKINSTVITNIYIVANRVVNKAANKVDELSKEKELSSGVEWTDILRKIPTEEGYFVFETGIAHYAEVDNPYSEPAMYDTLTKKVNTLMLTVLNHEDFPLNRKALGRREGLIPLLEKVSKSKMGEISFMEYKLEMNRLIPEMTLFDIPTPLHHIYKEGITKSKGTVNLFELDSFKEKEYDLGHALQITLTSSKNLLLESRLINLEQKRQLESIGFIEKDTAVAGCINQALDKLDYPSHPLGLFIHHLQHFYYHPLTDKVQFENDLIGMIQRQSKDIMPLLTDNETEFIGEYFIQMIKNMKLL